jgi:hypothetical protein
VSRLGVVEAPKWIEFQECVPRTKDAKTKVWAVVTKGGSEKEVGGIALGAVKWFGRWRRYAFFPDPATVYEPTCLRDIASFIDSEMQKRKAAR